jgi:hypothetical protein
MINMAKNILRDNPQTDFCIEIQYVKGSENPSRVFRAMTGIIDTCQNLDNHLIKVIDNNIEPILLLEDIETGSIKAWLANRIKQLPDDSLFHLDWKPIVGQYLVKSKYIIIDFLEGKTTISNIKELKPVMEKIFRLAEETGVRRLPAYTQPQAKDILEGIKDISASLADLNKEDSVKYITEEQEVSFNLEFKLAPESIEELLAKETISNEAEMILKVKKPDYLGESMWDFRFGDKTISVSVEDVDWLEKFQSRKVIVRPGDSIRGIMKTSHRYDYNGELIGTHYALTTIIEVMLAPDNEQSGMFGDGLDIT